MDVSDCLCIYMCVCLCPSVLVSARQLTCENVCVYVCVSFMNAPRFVSVEVFLFVSIRLNSLGIFDYSRFEQWIQILQATFPIVQWRYCICVFFRQQQQSAGYVVPHQPALHTTDLGCRWQHAISIIFRSHFLQSNLLILLLSTEVSAQSLKIT